MGALADHDVFLRKTGLERTDVGLRVLARAAGRYGSISLRGISGTFPHGAPADPPAGFRGSFTTSATRVPWLEADAVYEDWYLLDGSAALDLLDSAAVDARRRAAHDESARNADKGTAGLYRLIYGMPVVPAVSEWFAKPSGTTYGAFAGVLEATASGGATIWQRQMVLGPAPEFVAQTDGAGPVAGAVDAFRVTHVRVAGAKW